jgi:hypothetical protein
MHFSQLTLIAIVARSANSSLFYERLPILAHQLQFYDLPNQPRDFLLMVDTLLAGPLVVT